MWITSAGGTTVQEMGRGLMPGKIWNRGPVVQNFVSLTSSLRPQLVKLMPTTLSDAMQRILTF